MGQSCHNLFNHLSKAKSPAKQPFSILINWEAGQDKYKGVSAALETCDREHLGAARRQVDTLLLPYSSFAARSMLRYHSQMAFSCTKPRHYLRKNFMVFIPSGGFSPQTANKFPSTSNPSLFSCHWQWPTASSLNPESLYLKSVKAVPLRQTPSKIKEEANWSESS